MDVKPAAQNPMKMTEIGEIPEDWELRSIEGLANIRTGSKNTQDNIRDGQYPFFVRSQVQERIDSYSYDCEAVLTAGDGVGTGKIFHYIEGKFDAHQRVYVLTDFDESIDGYYFFLQFRANFLGRIERMTAKSSVDSVRREMIAEMKILLPSREEQKAIAEALSDADDYIRGLEKLVDKKRAIKQGAMQELLTGRRRLPGCAKSGNMKMTEIGEIPEDWECINLGRIFDVARRQVNPLASPEAIFQHFSLPAFDEFGEPQYEAGKSIQSNKFAVPNGAILVSKLNPRISRVWLVKEVEELAVCSTEFMALTCAQELVRRFAYQLLQSFIVKDFMTANASGTTGSHQRIDPSLFLQCEVSIPSSLEEQKAIAEVLSNMDDEIATLETQLDKAKQIKQAMMQELLTGRIRLI